MKHKFNHSKKPVITDGSGTTEVCILISGIPHIKFMKDKYLGLTSWYNSKTDFKIKIYLKGCTIMAEYDSVDKWKTVLNIINEQV